MMQDKNNEFEVRSYQATAEMNQRRMMADPFEVIMRNMHHRTMVEDLDVDLPPDYPAEFEERENQEFYTCRTS